MTIINNQWALAGVFPSPCNGHAGFVVGDRIFIGGGSQGAGAGTVSSKIYSCRVFPDGTLSPWAQAGDMPAALTFHNFLYNEADARVYMYGGNSTNPKLYSAPVFGDQVGSWTLVTQFGPSTANSGVGMVLVNNWLYLIGGAVNRCDSIRIGPGAGGMANSLPALPDIRTDAAVVTYGNYIYVIGGLNGSSPFDRGEVYSARIGPDGTLGSWTLVGNLLTTAARPCSAVVNDKLLIVGGRTGGSTSSAKVQVATLQPEGQISVFTYEQDFPVAFRSASRAMVVVGSRAIKVGGYTTTNNDAVYVATLNK